MQADDQPRAAASVRPYLLRRCKTRTGKFYMRRDFWDDMSDFGWGWRPIVGDRVSPYFDEEADDAMRDWCKRYVGKHPGNTLDAKEAESLATV